MISKIQSVIDRGFQEDFNIMSQEVKQIADNLRNNNINFEIIDGLIGEITDE
jgi:hypothetical protein